MKHIQRKLPRPERSFFLFGPRGAGKSTWLREVLPDALYLDLLNSALLYELMHDPSRLEDMAGALPPRSWIVIDEVQKIPALLDEAHRLMESKRWRFALCGSSARKIRGGGVNLLAGRAISVAMEGFSAAELGGTYDLKHALAWGTLPFVQQDAPAAREILEAYVQTYLREEIREEGLVRRVPPFLRFLSVAGQVNGQMVNALSLARDAAVARATVDTYFSILVDTLLGHFLPAWRPGLKVREAAHPKFYWFDPGVARAAAGLLRDPVDRAWEGAALETLVFHELRQYNEWSGKKRPLAYYRTPHGREVDFIVETARRSSSVPPRIAAIEVKRSERWDRGWAGALREFGNDSRIRCDRRIIVYCGRQRYQHEGIDVLPVRDFFRELHAGEVF